MSTVADSRILQAAMEYAALGWPVVAVREKKPFHADWPKRATTDEETIAQWWAENPMANLGILCGEKSGIVDMGVNQVPDGRTLLLSIFGGELPATIAFDATRGPHYWFRWRQGLPPKARYFIGDGALEIIPGNNPAQVVVPPSVFFGKPREWLAGCSPGEAELAEITDAALARLVNWDGMGIQEIELGAGKIAKPDEHWEKIAQGVSEGQRNQMAAEFIGKLLRMIDVFDNSAIAIQWELIQGWNTLNRPPLSDKELKTTFDSILKRERHQRTDKTHEAAFSRQVSRDPETGRVTSAKWRLVTITSDPPRHKLFSPLWEGPIILTSREYLLAESIRLAAFDQRGVWVPGSFGKQWRGDKKTPSLAAQLSESREEEEDADEARRPFIIAELLYTALTESPKSIGPEEEFDSRGYPMVTGEGAYVFKFSEVFRPMHLGVDKVKRHELTALIREVTENDYEYRPRIAGIQVKRHRLVAEAFARLRVKVLGTA